MEDIILYKGNGTPQARYWYNRHILREKFGLSAKEADDEPITEAVIHLNIWGLQSEREQHDIKQQERKSTKRS